MYQLYHTKQNVFWNLDTHNHLSPHIFKEYVNTSNNWVYVPNISLKYETTFTAKIVVPIDLETNYFKQVFKNKTTYWYVVLSENYTLKTKTLVLEMDIYATYIIDLFLGWNPNKKVFMDRAHKKTYPKWGLSDVDRGFTLTDDDLVLSVANTNPRYEYIASKNITEPSKMPVFSIDEQATPFSQFSLPVLYVCLAKTGDPYFDLYPVWEYNVESVSTQVAYPKYWIQPSASSMSITLDDYDYEFNKDRAPYTLISGTLGDVLRSIDRRQKLAHVIGFYWGPDIKSMYYMSDVSTRAVLVDKNYLMFQDGGTSKPTAYSKYDFNQARHVMYFRFPTAVGRRVVNSLSQKIELANIRENATKIKASGVKWNNHCYYLYNYLTTYVGATEINLCNLNFELLVKDINIVNGMVFFLKNCSQPLLLSTTFPLNVDTVEKHFESIANQWNVGTNKLIADGVVEIARSSIKGASSAYSSSGERISGIYGGILGGAIATTQLGIDIGFRSRELEAKRADMYAATPYQPPQVELKDLSLLEVSQGTPPSYSPYVSVPVFGLYRKNSGGSSAVPVYEQQLWYRDAHRISNNVGFPVIVKTYDDSTLQSMSDVLRWYGLRIGKWLKWNDVNWGNVKNGVYQNPCYFLKFSRNKMLNNLEFNGPSEIRTKILDVLSSGLRLWNQLTINENFDLDLDDSL